MPHRRRHNPFGGRRPLIGTGLTRHVRGAFRRQHLGAIRVEAAKLAIDAIVGHMRRSMRSDAGVPDQKTEQQSEAEMATCSVHSGFDRRVRCLFTRRLVYPEPDRDVLPGAVQRLVEPPVAGLERRNQAPELR